jgi:hypothetical protein
MRSRAPLWAAIVTFAVVTAVVGTTLRLRGDVGAASVRAGEPAPVASQVVQLRFDEAYGRVEVALRNVGSEPVVVRRLRLRVDGFTGAGWLAKNSPVPAGQVVNLPTGYGKPRCPATGAPAPGGIRVDVRLVVGSDPTVRAVRSTPTASRPLLTRILRSLCAEQRLQSEVTLALGPRWRTEGSGDATRLHTTLEARLAPGAPPRDLTQVAGTVLYDIHAETATGPPYARLDQQHPAASVPVVLSQARCTGHAKGEVKKPYEFLVWLGDPGTGGTAVVLALTAAEKQRLRAVCAF